MGETLKRAHRSGGLLDVRNEVSSGQAAIVVIGDPLAVKPGVGAVDVAHRATSFGGHLGALRSQVLDDGLASRRLRRRAAAQGAIGKTGGEVAAAQGEYVEI